MYYNEKIHKLSEVFIQHKLMHIATSCAGVHNNSNKYRLTWMAVRTFVVVDECNKLIGWSSHCQTNCAAKARCDTMKPGTVFKYWDLSIVV